MSTDKPQPGDSVKVIGQSVRMTVSHSFGQGESEQTVCIWFDVKNRVQRASFLTRLLVFWG